jgi:hypothetical protein
MEAQDAVVRGLEGRLSEADVQLRDSTLRSQPRGVDSVRASQSERSPSVAYAVPGWPVQLSKFSMRYSDSIQRSLLSLKRR